MSRKMRSEARIAGIADKGCTIRVLYMQVVDDELFSGHAVEHMKCTLRRRSMSSFHALIALSGRYSGGVT